jgi:nucleotide-binding universal stress UspA family protein
MTSDKPEQRQSPEGAVRSVLVAIDESEQAQWALEQAVNLAHALNAKLSLIYVVNPTPALTPDFDVEVATQSNAVFARGLMKNMASQVPSDLLGEQILVIGAPAPQILAAALRVNADLIVIGTHGRGVVGQVFLGSVADAVIRASVCPVMTVSHPRTDPSPALYALRGENVEPAAAPHQ